MRFALPHTSEQRRLAAVFLMAALLIAAGYAFAVFSLRGVAQPLIVNFNDRLGINQIGDLADLAAIAASGFVVVAVNAALAFALEGRSRFLARLVAGSTGAMAVLLFLALLAIIGVN